MDYSILEKCKLFKGLSTNDIKDSISNISCYIKRFEEGEIIYHLTSKADKIGLILKGRVQAQKIFSNGENFRFSVREMGDIIGPIAALSGIQRYPFEVTALEPTEILIFERMSFLRLLQKDVRIMENFISELAFANLLLQRRLELLTYKAMQQKIAFYLLSVSVESGIDKVSIPGTMTEWALMMNVSRPSLHREIKKMEEQGLISYMPPIIKVLDVKGLREILEQ